jgi:hypothetical protein
MVGAEHDFGAFKNGAKRTRAHCPEIHEILDHEAVVRYATVGMQALAGKFFRHLTKVSPKCGLFVSFPKSGRTWLRVMLDDLGLWLDYSHADSDHRTGKGVDELPDPSAMLGRRKVIFLHRDPRDVVISGYFETSRRMGGERLYRGSLSDFIRDPRHGIEKIVRFNEAWLTACARRSDVCILSYEDVHGDTAAALRRIARFLGKRKSEQRIARAVEAGRFDVMREREATGAYAARYGSKLRPKDSSDPDSFKVRRGVVGGWRDYLSPDDSAYCESIIRRPPAV